MRRRCEQSGELERAERRRIANFDYLHVFGYRHMANNSVHDLQSMRDSARTTVVPSHAFLLSHLTHRFDLKAGRMIKAGIGLWVFKAAVC